jgi:hypothetical protein
MPKKNKKIQTAPKIEDEKVEDEKKVEEKSPIGSSLKKNHLIAALAAFIIILASLGVFIALKHYKKPISQLQQIPKLMVEEAKENNLMEGKSAIALGLAEAQKWQADAELSYVFSENVGQLKGRSNDWKLIFVSKSVKGKGFQVKIADAKISDTSEISYTGQAAELPVDTISQAEAVAQVKAIPGFANVKILGVDMIYSKEVKTWYWGVRTDKGTVSVIAAKEKIK